MPVQIARILANAATAKRPLQPCCAARRRLRVGCSGTRDVPLTSSRCLDRRPPVSRYFAVGTLAAALLAASWTLARPAPAPAPGEPPFHALLKKTAGEYLAYGRVDDEMRWAPFLCRMPQPATAHVSASKDGDTHGRKLYSLFARDRAAYLRLPDRKIAPAGQVRVKQSCIPEEVPAVAGIAFQDVVDTPPPG